MEPVPPAGRWTLVEVVAALLSDLYAAAMQLPPENWRIAGGGERHGKARATPRLAFSRRMGITGLVVSGTRNDGAQPSNIPCHIWRAGHFHLSPPDGPDLASDVYVVGQAQHDWRSRLAKTASCFGLGGP